MPFFIVYYLIQIYIIIWNNASSSNFTMELIIFCILCGFLIYSYFLSLIVEKQSLTNLSNKLKSRMGRSLQTSYEHQPVSQIALVEAFSISVSNIGSNRYVKMIYKLLKLIISTIILYSFYVIVQSSLTLFFIGFILLLIRFCRKFNT